MPIVRLLRHAFIAVVAAIAVYLGIRFAQYQIAREAIDNSNQAEVANVQGDLLTLALLDQMNNYSSLGKVIEAHKPKFTLVNLWATWCAPCREELPLFEQVFLRIPSEDVLVVGIADDDFDKVRAFVDSLGIGFTQLINDGSILNLPDYFGTISAVPLTVLLNGKGNLIASKFGSFHDDELFKFVEKHTGF